MRREGQGEEERRTKIDRKTFYFLSPIFKNNVIFFTIVLTFFRLYFSAMLIY